MVPLVAGSRKHSTLAPLLALFVGLAAITGTALAQTQADPYLPGEILIKFAPGTSPAEIAAIRSDLGATAIRQFARIGVSYERITRLTVEQAIARYRGDHRVSYIEPNYVLHAFEIPNDPLFPQLWGMHNTGQTGGLPGADIHATQAWDVFTGSSSVLVAIIDTGMDYNHQELSPNVFTNTGEIAGNGIDDDNNGFVDDVHGYDFANGDGDPMDDNGHGTHCSGTIGAVGNNAVGVAGVNWHVTMMPVKFLNQFGSGSEAGAIASIEYATMMGAKVMSNSWGGGGFSQAMYDAIKAAGDAGIVFVAAAGNASSNNDVFPAYPASYDLPNIISVAATDANDHLAGFSNFGPTTVDLAAPGVDILSTAPGGNYQFLSGTSMATPHVSGAAALVFGRYPGIDGASVKTLLLAKVDPVPSLAGLILTGGRLNAFLPIAEADSIPPDPVQDLAVSQTNGNWIELQWTATGDDGVIGRATRYDMRYSTSPIDAANFDSASQATGEPDPLPSGSPQQMRVNGLGFSTPYYFALKAYDELGNASGISNLATGTTLGPPDVSVAPPSLSADLLTGEQTTRTLTISNNGVSELRFNLGVQPVGAPASAASRVTATYRASRATAAGTGAAYDAGRVAGRAPLRSAALRAPGSPNVAGLRVLLLQSGSDVSELQGALLSFPEISQVDVFDGNSAVPTLDFLRGYNTVVTVANVPYGDPAGIGNVLADYVDAGGGVVLTLATFINGWNLTGRFLSDGYFPFDLGTGPIGSSSLGSYDASHPIMQGVTAATGDLLGQVTVAAGANLVASWVNGVPMVATKGFRVAAVNLFFGGAGFWTGDVPRLMRNAAFWAGGAPNFLALDPKTGAVQPGLSVDVQVTFNAERLNGGNYDANITVDSNDPDQPRVLVPAHLHVTGAPDITAAPTALEFGPTFITAVKPETVIVVNDGTDLLSVTGVNVAPADFSAPTAGFDLNPGERRPLIVSFSPLTATDISGSLEIHSNDPDEPLVTVTLHGTGLVPPDISVEPSSYSLALLTGETATRTLTIHNTGGSPLVFDIGMSFTGPAPSIAHHAILPGAWSSRGTGAPARSDQARPAVAPAKTTHSTQAVKRVLLVEDTLPWGLASNEAVLAANGIDYDVTSSAGLAGINLSTYRLVIVASDQSTYTYGVLAGQAAKFASYVTGGGVLEFHAAGWGSQGGDASQVTLPGGMHIVQYYSYYNNVLDPAHPLMAGVPNPFTGNFASHSYFTNIPADAHLIASADAGQPDLVTYRVGAGQVIAGGQTFEFGYGYGQDPGIILNNMIPYAAALGRSWLAANPSTGSIPIGSSQDVTLTFDAAGLFGGDYHADIQVHSNDPDQPLVTVPADLHVTGAPDITVSATHLDFGQVFTGGAKPETVVVVNDGTDLLSISSVAITPADYTVATGSFDLAPGESHPLVVTFAPQSVASIPGTLEIHSNDPDEALVTVTLSGEGIVPPDIGIDPTAFDAALLTGETTSRTLTIRNTGGSNLVFSLSARAVTPGPRAVGGPGATLGAGVLHGLPGATALARATQAVVSTIARPGSAQSRAGTATPGSSSHPDPLAAAPAARLAGNDILVLSTTSIDFSLLLVLQQMSLGYDLVYTEDFTGIDFTPYKTILVGMNGGGISEASCQALANAASAGRLLIMVGGTNWTPYYNGLQTYLLQHTGETGWVTSNTPHLHVLDPADGLATGLPASYNYFEFGASYYMLRIADPAAHNVAENGDHHPTLVHKNIGSGTLVYFTAPASDYFWYNAGDFAVLKQILTNALTFSPAGWLTLDPTQGNLPPGGEATIQVGFNATGLFGGDYYADIQVASNDPDEALLTASAHLHVTGAPDITVSAASLDFGTVYTGSAKPETVTVINDGTDVLSVSSVSATPADYSVPGGPFDLQPRQRRDLIVTFAPQTPASIPGTLEIHSNDPDEGLVSVALHGQGVVPPDIHVDPTSLSVDLLTNQHATRTLTVHNTGGADLVFGVFSRAAGPRPNVIASADGLRPLGGGAAPVHVVAVESARALARAIGRSATPHDLAPTETPGAAGHPVQLQSGPGAPLAGNDIVVLSTTWIDYSVLLVLQQLGRSYDLIYTSDFTWIDFSPYRTIIVAMDGGFVDQYSCQALANAASAGRSLIMIGGTNLDPYYQGVQAYLLGHTGEEGWVISAPPHLTVVNPADPLASGLPATYTYHDAAAAYYMLRISDPAAGIAAQNGDYHPVLIHKPLGTGALVYFTSSPYSAYWSDSTDFAVLKRILQNALAYSSVPWLSVTPTSGNVPGGGELALQVDFDATGLAGDFDADIQISSNDPDQGVVTVPAHMHVTGVPDIAVSAPSLDFGQVFTGTSRKDTIQVSNVGNQDLHVTSTSVDNSVFSTPSGPYTLAPGANRKVIVTYSPTTSGPSDGSLTFHSDDPDEGSLVVPLHGQAVTPPDVAVSPAAIQEVMLPDDQLDEALRIENHGGFALTWSIDLGFDAVVSVAETQPVVTAQAPKETQKTVATVPPRRPTGGMVVRSGGAAPGTSGSHRVAARALATSTATPSATPGTLAETLALLDGGSALVTALIPNRYDFTEGETGNSIVDGGNDMYDGGNFMITSMGGPIDYSNGVIQPNPLFGATGAYFTRKYPGLFVLAADMDNVDYFFTVGDLGADNVGSADGATLHADLHGHHYIGYVKRDFNAPNPSVNHLIIFEDPEFTSHTFASNTNSDYDEVDGLGLVGRFYYLLFARANGGYVDNATMTQIMRTFLGVVNPAPTWVTAAPESGVVAPQGFNLVNLHFDTHGLPEGQHDANVLLYSDDPDQPLVTIPVSLVVTGPTATEVALVSSATQPGLVRLTWHASSPASITAAAVFRSAKEGEWAQIAPITPAGNGDIVFEDHEVTPGTRYGYRLGITEANVQRFVGETWVTVPSAVALALHGMEPNPAVGDLTVAFSLPDAQPASLDLLDLAGRRLLSREVGSQGAGRHVVSLGQSGTLPAGVYMVRLQRAGKVMVKKAIVMK